MSNTVQEQPQAQAPPQATQQASSGGPINDADVKIWTDRLNDILARPSEHLNSSSPQGAQSWFAGFFDCFNPIDTCLITWCLPCVTFGRAHHRMHKDPELEGYEVVNTSCLVLLGASCVGCFCVPVAMQHQMIREKYNLEGSCVSDILRAWCCGCCTIMQQDKETGHQERLLRQQMSDPKQGYQAATEMTMPPK